MLESPTMSRRMSKKQAIMMINGVLAAAVALALLDHPPAVGAQQRAHSEIESISVSADQTLTYPDAAPVPYLNFFPDEHMTFLPPASSSSPYLVFGASTVTGTSIYGFAVVLESTDLKTFDFATAQGYPLIVLTVPALGTPAQGYCDPTYLTEFDTSYAAPGFVAQDPTLPAGNLVMVYEAENHCVGGAYNGADGYASVGFTRSSNNGITWPEPETGPLGGPDRYPVLQSFTTPPTTAAPAVGNLAGAGFVDKSLDGNYYLYVTYQVPGVAEPEFRVGRGALGHNPVSFMKWSNGSFSQPGLGGTDTPVVSSACAGHHGQASIYYVDDVNTYLMTFVCFTGTSSAWYYSTATSLDIQDWTKPQMILNSQYPEANTSNCGPTTDGFFPSFMSPGAASGHLTLEGTVFLTNGCLLGARTFTSRTFTITTKRDHHGVPLKDSGRGGTGLTSQAP